MKINRQHEDQEEEYKNLLQEANENIKNLNRTLEEYVLLYHYRTKTINHEYYKIADIFLVGKQLDSATRSASSQLNSMQFMQKKLTDQSSIEEQKLSLEDELKYLRKVTLVSPSFKPQPSLADELSNFTEFNENNLVNEQNSTNNNVSPLKEEELQIDSNSIIPNKADGEKVEIVNSQNTAEEQKQTTIHSLINDTNKSNIFNNENRERKDTNTSNAIEIVRGSLSR